MFVRLLHTARSYAAWHAGLLPTSKDSASATSFLLTDTIHLASHPYSTRARAHTYTLTHTCSHLHASLHSHARMHARTHAHARAPHTQVHHEDLDGLRHLAPSYVCKRPNPHPKTHPQTPTRSHARVRLARTSAWWSREGTLGLLCVGFWVCGRFESDGAAQASARRPRLTLFPPAVWRDSAVPFHWSLATCAVRPSALEDDDGEVRRFRRGRPGR